MSDLVGVIPAAGRGTRAYPYTEATPKCLLALDGEPILGRILALFRDQMRIRHVVIVVGELGHAIRATFGDGTDHGLRITYVQNHDIDRGLSHSLLLARPHVGEYFAVILSDECYLDSNHHELLAAPYEGCLATCAVAAERSPEQVAKNYAVEVEGGLIRRIIEKPTRPGDALLGLGTFLFHRRIFDHLEAALQSAADGPTDPVSVLGRLCARGERVMPFFLAGRYVNINDRDELNLANYYVRSKGFEERSRSLAVIYRRSLEASLRTVAEFRALDCFRQVTLVLPPEIGLPVPPPDVEVVRAPSGRYGDLLRAGLDASRADILFAVEGDGSFLPRDVPKFLAYLRDADLVVGTRTTRQLIGQGTNMRGIVRLAHVLLGKLLEFVWWKYEPRLTDVGCTYRGLWRSTYRLIRPHLCTSGPEASVEMLLETLYSRKRVVEIPVGFQLRKKGRRRQHQNVGTVLAMVTLIVGRRLVRFGGARAIAKSSGPVTPASVAS